MIYRIRPKKFALKTPQQGHAAMRAMRNPNLYSQRQWYYQKGIGAGNQGMRLRSCGILNADPGVRCILLLGDMK